jgi:glucose dehydrogenase
MRRITSFVVLVVFTGACSSAASDPAPQTRPSSTDRVSATHPAVTETLPIADWPMYGHDLARSFANPTSGLTAGNVKDLVPAWTFATGDVVTAQAIVSHGVVYFGSWDGYFYAVDQLTGALRWKFAVDCQNAIVPSPARCVPPDQQPPRAGSDGGIVTSSAAVFGDTVYFGGGRTLYALAVNDGTLRWKHVICGNPDDPSCASDANDGLRIFSSPAVFDGLVYVGTSADGQSGYRGGFYAFDAGTGAQRWHFELDPILDAQGHPILNANGLPSGGYNRGCGNAWSSASIDVARQLVVFGTSDCNNLPLLPYHDAIIALDARTGRLRWAFTPHANDTSACDVDFGATPNLAQEPYAAVGGKDGSFYLVDRANGSASAATNVVFGGSAGGFFGGAAFSGGNYFSATGFGDFSACNPSDPRDLELPQDPSMHAFDGRTDAVLWEQSGAQSVVATVAGDGVAFVTYNNLFAPAPPFAALQAYDTASGALVLSIPLAASDGPATPVGGMLLEPTGNLQDGSGGGVIAYVLSR